MYIKLINCEYVHIYDKTSFVYTTDGVFVLDSVSTQLISILKFVSCFDSVVSRLGEQMELDSRDAFDLANNIIKVNHRFLSISNSPNTVIITGKLAERFPSMLQIALTNKCVHQCKHCFKKCDLMGGNDFPFDSLVQLLHQVDGECRFIEFTGGEPLLYPRIMEIVRSFHRQFHFHITTSGYLLHTFDISDLEKFRLVQISLHGSTASIHDSFVGRRGSYYTVTKNIRWLCVHGINVVVSRCVQSYDADELSDFIELCINLGVKRVMFGIIIPVGRAVQTGCMTPYSEYVQITAFLKRAQEEYPQINIVLDEEHAVSKQHSEYIFHCIGGRLHLYVDEKGDVFPCPYCQEDSLSMGNIVMQPEIVNSIIYQAQYDVYNEEIRTQPISRLQSICPNIREPEQ